MTRGTNPHSALRDAGMTQIELPNLGGDEYDRLLIDWLDEHKGHGHKAIEELRSLLEEGEWLASREKVLDHTTLEEWDDMLGKVLVLYVRLGRFVTKKRSHHRRRR